MSQGMAAARKDLVGGPAVGLFQFVDNLFNPFSQ